MRCGKCGAYNPDGGNLKECLSCNTDLVSNDENQKKSLGNNLKQENKRFIFRVLTPGGQKVKWQSEAPDEKSARERLLSQGFKIIESEFQNISIEEGLVLLKRKQRLRQIVMIGVGFSVLVLGRFVIDEIVRPYLANATHANNSYEQSDVDEKNAKFLKEAAIKTGKDIADLNKIIKSNPNDADAYFKRALCFSWLGERENEISDLNMAIKLSPNKPQFLCLRGNAYSSLKKYREAIADLNEAVRIAPKWHGAYFARGSAYQSKGDLDLAIADFNQAILLNPKEEANYLDRGETYFEKGDLDRALSDFNVVLKMKPDFAKAYFDRGAAYFEKKNFEDGLRDIRKASEMGDRDAKKFLHHLEEKETKR